jgi:hypothetical protein
VELVTINLTLNPPSIFISSSFFLFVSLHSKCNYSRIECAGNFIQTNYDTPDCSGTGTEVANGPNPGNICQNGFSISCALKCFHKER